MSSFDFGGDYPVPEPEPEKPLHRLEGFDEKVDYLMAVRGYDRDEAERVALEILLDDAA